MGKQESARGLLFFGVGVMGKAFDAVVTVRLENQTERKLRRLAKADDRSLASFLRLRLRQLAASSSARPKGPRDAAARDLSVE
jgi:hypothetical protein